MLVGGFVGFLGGSVTLAAHNVARARGSRARERAMQLDAMQKQKALGSMGPMRTAAPPVRTSPVNLMKEIERLELLAATDLEAAIVLAEKLRAEHPKSAVLLTRLALFLLAAERVEPACAAAAEALTAAVAIGAMPLAIELHDDFREHLPELPVDGTVFVAIARALSDRERHDHALACLDHAAKLEVTVDWAREAAARVRARAER